MLRKGYQGFLAVVRDGESKVARLEDTSMVSEFANVFLEELPGLPPIREIKFCINLVLGTQPISIPPYRMAPTKLKDQV